MSELHTDAVRSLTFSRLRMSANRMMRKSMQCVAALALVTLGSGMAWADFSLTFQGLVQTLNTGSDIYLSSPAGIVVDPAGDVFVVNTGHNCIVEVTAQGVPSILTITGLSTALLGPSSIAIDGSGNLLHRGYIQQPRREDHAGRSGFRRQHRQRNSQFAERRGSRPVRGHLHRGYRQ